MKKTNDTSRMIHKGEAFSSMVAALSAAAALAIVPMSQAQALGLIVNMPTVVNVTRTVTATAEGRIAAKSKAISQMKCPAPLFGNPFAVTELGWTRGAFGTWDFTYTYRYSYKCKRNA